MTVSPQLIYDYLTKEKGLSHIHAIGIIANIRAESSFNVDGYEQPTEQYKGEGVGLFQYSKTAEGADTKRRTDFLTAVPDWEKNWKGQVDYAIDKDPMTKPYINRTFQTAEDASSYWTTKWEIPADKYEKAKERLAYVEEYQKTIVPSNDEVSRRGGIREDVPKNHATFGDWLSVNYNIMAEDDGSISTSNYEKYYPQYNRYLDSLKSPVNAMAVNKGEDLLKKKYTPTPPQTIAYRQGQEVKEGEENVKYLAYKETTTDPLAPAIPPVKGKPVDPYEELIAKNQKDDQALTLAGTLANAAILGWNMKQPSTRPITTTPIAAETVKLERPNILGPAKTEIDKGFNTAKTILMERGFDASSMIGLTSGRNTAINQATIQQGNIDAEISAKEASINAELSRQKQAIDAELAFKADTINAEIASKESLMRGNFISGSLQGLMSNFSGYLGRNAKRSESLIGYDLAKKYT